MSGMTLLWPFVSSLASELLNSGRLYTLILSSFQDESFVCYSLECPSYCWLYFAEHCSVINSR